ncbi:MAG: DUF4349 domain-containing protein [Actinobacteria bacterium]|uniref:Unannotated protein n=1 Tax=freshwater metagenome TaxID=449393 RepID=A0A6J7PUH5_9ZZZZ|nr:DUF4349 domain-containing protein [Actinomycetota bacterium]
MRFRSALLGAMAAVLLVALTGCGGSSSSSSETASGGNVDSKGLPSVSGDPTVQQPREVVRNADIGIRVDDVRASVGGISAIAQSAQGRVSNESIDTFGGGAEFASMTLRIPASSLDDSLARIGALGTVTSLYINSDDVTAQGIDLDARVAALQTSVTRLRQLLAQAKSTGELLAIEKELSARQAELDSLVAQRKALSESVALSTVTVQITPASVASESLPPGFAAGLGSGWSALRNVVAALVTVAGFMLPFALVLMVIGVPALLIVLVVRKRRRG